MCFYILSILCNRGKLYVSSSQFFLFPVKLTNSRVTYIHVHTALRSNAAGCNNICTFEVFVVLIVHMQTVKYEICQAG